ncbi:RDD domain containing protein [Rhodococcus wratislaviensis IFP 2016]|nr:RDD domain containing protein [Rhodococcus wratislaviensis IFP 2016]
MYPPPHFAYPPQTGPRPAELGMRIAARLLDFLFAGIIMVAVNLAIVGVGLVAGLPDGLLSIALLANMIVLPLTYEWVQLALWGATLGKRVLGLKVVRTDGTPLSWPVAAGRALLNAPYVSSWLILMVLPLANFICMLADSPERRGLHSRATKTVVLDTRPRAPRYPYPPTPYPPTPYPPT